MTKIAYFDVFAGASGDMLLGALVDAGADLGELQTRLDGLRLPDGKALPGFHLEARPVLKNGLHATKVEVVVTDTQTERHLSDILAILAASELPTHIKTRAAEILERIGRVEAVLHGAEPQHVHLHELGGLDTIVDVTGSLLALDLLGVERVECSPLPLGRGFIHSAHGKIPLPAPATAGLLIGAPVVGSEIAGAPEAELVTPTGAALLTGLAESYGPLPAMTLQAIGHGAGGRDLPIPNFLRVFIGEAAEASGEVTALRLLSTNIDDQNPELYEHVLARLLGAGALDVTLASVQMKKNRPAVELSVLAEPENVGALEAILFAETSTLGVRRQWVERRALPRTSHTVQTPYGDVRIKRAEYAPGQFKAAPEYEDCRRLAAEQGVPLREVYQAALLAAGEQIP